MGVVVTLLILIVLILLFGAAVVKGWLANALGYGCVVIFLFVGVFWLGSQFGENGVENLVLGILGVLGVLVVIGLFSPSDQKPFEYKASQHKSTENEAPGQTPPPAYRPDERDTDPRDVEVAKKIWGVYARRLESHLTASELAVVQTMIRDGHVQQMEWQCKTWVKQKLPR